MIGHTASANFPRREPLPEHVPRQYRRISAQNRRPADPCTYSIAPTNQSFGASGGTGSITRDRLSPGLQLEHDEHVELGDHHRWLRNGHRQRDVLGERQRGCVAERHVYRRGPGVHGQPGGSACLGNCDGGNTERREKLYTGTAYRIDWTATGSITRFDVEASTNGGLTYVAVPGCSALGGAARSCTWATPGPVTSTGFVKVLARNAAGAIVSDVSNGPFSILSGVGTIKPHLSQHGGQPRHPLSAAGAVDAQSRHERLRANRVES